MHPSCVQLTCAFPPPLPLISARRPSPPPRPQSNTFFLVMEYAGGGSLVRFMAQHDRLRRCLDEDTAGRVFAQIVSALDYCHRR